MFRRFATRTALTAVVLPGTLVAQIFATEPARDARTGWGLDIAFQVAQPIDELAANIGHAFGVGSTVHHHFRGFRPLGIRGDFAYLNYGNERQRVPLSSTVNRVQVEMNTSNNILLLSAGPELALPNGPVRPYVHGFVGYSYFFTQSSAGDDNGGGAFASTTNFDDGGLATGAGAGLRIPVRTRRTEVSIDGGARFTRNGTREYLRSGDITDNPDGSLSFTPRVSEADFWLYYLGVSLSFGRSRR